MSLYNEIKRRNVFRVAIAYLAAAWLLIEVAGTLFPAFGVPDWVFRFLVIVFALGFMPVLVISWAYELTPEGLKREKDVVRDATTTHVTARRLDAITIGLIVVALAFILVDRMWLAPAPVEQSADPIAVTTDHVQTFEPETNDRQFPPNSIAVMPFVNMSDDAGNEYFSDGISEELLNALAQVPRLRVISRSSAFSFKGKDIKLAQVAEELNVAHILEGSVRKAGNIVRITVQLIDVRSDTHLWSETYDRQLDDIFAIQDEIAATVVEQLKITMLGAPPKGQEADPEAYALFLQARYLARQRSVKGYEQSNTLYQQALAIESDYTAALSGLAGNYINQTTRGLLPTTEGYPLARDMLQKALAIDPDHARAHSLLGYIEMVNDNDLAQSARHFERALQLDPADVDIISSAATLLRDLGRLDESIAVSQYTSVRDPVSPTGHINLGNAYLYARRWDEAFASYQAALRLSPDYIGAHYRIGTALLFKGEAERALAEFSLKEVEEGDDEYRVKGQALAFHALGRQAEYRAKLEELIENWGDQWPSEVAHVYAYAGDAEQAFLWLDRAIELHEDGLTGQFLLPFYTPLHGDPRWAKFLERIGSSPEQLDVIEFKVTLPK